MIEQTVDVEIAISNWDPRYIYEEDVSRRYEIRAIRNSTKFPVVSDRRIGKCDVKSIFLSSGGGSIVRLPFYECLPPTPGFYRRDGPRL